MVVRGCEEGKWGLFHGYRVLVLQDEEFWRLDSTLLNCVVKNGEDGIFYVLCILSQLKI